MYKRDYIGGSLSDKTPIVLCRLQLSMKCIIFVKRIVIARSLTYILQNLENLASWRCDYLVGVHSGLRSMSRKNMKAILEKFQSGKVLIDSYLFYI